MFAALIALLRLMLHKRLTNVKRNSTGPRTSVLCGLVADGKFDFYEVILRERDGRKCFVTGGRDFRV